MKYIFASVGIRVAINYGLANVAKSYSKGNFCLFPHSSQSSKKPGMW